MIRQFDDGRRVLARFGYHPAAIIEDRAAMWSRLMGDFPRAPAWDALDEPARAAAHDYMRLRRESDRLLEACEALHREMLKDGITTARVERYAEAREAYEEHVEAFGAARERLAALL